jgi:transposase
LRERAVRTVAEVRSQHDTEWAATRAVAELLGVSTTENVRKWVCQHEIDESAVSPGGGAGNQPSSTAYVTVN